LTEEPNGNTLVISLADENDAGDYICQVTAPPNNFVTDVPAE
jgi:hypothetical protein